MAAPVRHDDDHGKGSRHNPFDSFHNIPIVSDCDRGHNFTHLGLFVRTDSPSLSPFPSHLFAFCFSDHLYLLVETLFTLPK